MMCTVVHGSIEIGVKERRHAVQQITGFFLRSFRLGVPQKMYRPCGFADVNRACSFIHAFIHFFPSSIPSPTNQTDVPLT